MDLRRRRRRLLWSMLTGAGGGIPNLGLVLDAEPAFQGATLDANPRINQAAGRFRSWDNDPTTADRVGLYQSGGPFMPLTDKAFASIFTYTRASTAYDFSAAGVLTSYATDAIRQGYDPATLLPAGWLLEGASTNLLLNSTTLSTQSVTVAAALHVLSFYGTGTVTLTGASTAGPLVGTGANNLVQLSFTPTAGSLTLTVSGSVTNAQLEANNTATSRIITAGSPISRAADALSIAGSQFTQIFGAGAPSGFVICDVMMDTQAAATRPWFQLDDGTDSNGINVRPDGGGNTMITRPTIGGTLGAASSSAGNAIYGAPTRAGLRWGGGVASLCFQGGSLQNISVTLPALSALRLGRTAGGAALNGRVRGLWAGSVALSDAKLIAASTLGADVAAALR